MKRSLLLLICAVLLLTAVSCGAPGPAARTVTTVSEEGDTTVETVYRFAGDRLEGVSQTVTYTDADKLELDYGVISGKPDLFTGLYRDGLVIGYTLTEKCLAELFPDVDCDSIVASAEENGLTITTD